LQGLELHKSGSCAQQRVISRGVREIINRDYYTAKGEPKTRINSDYSPYLSAKYRKHRGTRSSSLFNRYNWNQMGNLNRFPTSHRRQELNRGGETRGRDRGQTGSVNTFDSLNYIMAPSRIQVPDDVLRMALYLTHATLPVLEGYVLQKNF